MAQYTTKCSIICKVPFTSTHAHSRVRTPCTHEPPVQRHETRDTVRCKTPLVHCRFGLCTRLHGRCDMLSRGPCTYIHIHEVVESRRKRSKRKPNLAAPMARIVNPAPKVVERPVVFLVPPRILCFEVWCGLVEYVVGAILLRPYRAQYLCSRRA